MKRSKILHSSKCRFLNEFRCLFLSNQENPNQGQSNRLDTNGYNWDNGALLHVVVAVRGLLSQALKIPWNRHFQVTHATDRHLETSVLVIILQFSSCREAAVETAGNWLIAAETAAGSYCLAGAEFALAFGSSHGEPLISQTYSRWTNYSNPGQLYPPRPPKFQSCFLLPRVETGGQNKSNPTA